MSYKILQGDVIDRLGELPDCSVHCVVTSPPYWGLRDYGVAGQLGLEASPAEYVARLVEVFEQVRRVLRKDGTCWVNLGDSYAASLGQRKTTDNAGPKQRSNYASTGAPSRSVVGLKPKDLCGIPWRVAFALQDAGWWLRQDIIWSKPNPMPESVTDRCTKAHEYLFLLTKSAQYNYDAAAIREHGNKTGTLAHLQGGNGERAGTRPGLRRAHVVAKRLEPDSQALDSFEVCDDGSYRQYRNKRSVWEVPTQPYAEAHFATFPEELIRPCILAGCPVGGTVLDPFSGSGTTGVVALRHHREYIGIELNPEYVDLSHRRIKGDSPLFNTGVANG